MNQVCLNQCWNVIHICAMKIISQLLEIHMRWNCLPVYGVQLFFFAEGRMLRIFTKTGLLFYSKSFPENIKAAINWAWGSSQHGLIWVHPSVHLNTNSLFLPNLCLKRDQEDFLKPRGIISITLKLWLEFTVGKARVDMNIIKKKCNGKIHWKLVYMWLKEALKSVF